MFSRLPGPTVWLLYILSFFQPRIWILHYDDRNLRVVSRVGQLDGVGTSR